MLLLRAHNSLLAHVHQTQSAHPPAVASHLERYAACSAPLTLNFAHLEQKCAAPFVANERGEGCGFGDAQPNNNALAGANGQANGSAPPAPAAPAAPAPAASAPPAKAAGTQFITGPCTSDADCAAGCCGFNSGKCAGAVVAQERDGGCGFGDAQPNDNAAKALQGKRLGRRGPNFM
jgi:hypothetical protein